MYFEDLEVWKSARELTNRIYKITVEGGFAKDYGLRDQIRRAAVSIMSNIAEGYGRKSRKEFTQFLSISYGSGLELETQLTLSKRIKLGNSGEIKNALDLLQEILKMLNSMISKLKKGNLNAVR